MPSTRVSWMNESMSEWMHDKGSSDFPVIWEVDIRGTRQIYFEEITQKDKSGPRKANFIAAIHN